MIRTRKYIRTAWLVPGLMVLALGVVAPLQAAEVRTSPEQASKFIQDLGKQAVGLLAARPDGNSRDLQMQLRELIRQAFDLDLISRFALGASWATATPAQRLEYQRLFAAWMADSYARRLGADKAGSLTVIDGRPDVDSADALVRTRINRSDAPAIETDLRVRDSEGGMKIIDVTMGGVSLDVTQRDQFASVIKRKGLDGLISELRARTSTPSVEAAR
jgi:phospholipid transport system substrate-binding protein